MDDENYRSGRDFTLEFVGLRYGFNRRDFGERVVTAARRLGLVDGTPLAPAAVADLVELAACARLPAPRSSLGERLAANADLLNADGHDAAYWLRKLVFRSAWLDQRVKKGLIDVTFDEDGGTFRYAADGFSLPVSSERDIPWFAAHRYPDI